VTHINWLWGPLKFFFFLFSFFGWWISLIGPSHKNIQALDNPKIDMLESPPLCNLYRLQE
jgi:hypothetical protein